MTPSDVKTLSWPPKPTPVPVRLRALQIARSHIGEREIVEGYERGKDAPAIGNQGPIVRWSCERWTSPERFQREYAAGKMAWCAGFVSSCFLEACAPDLAAQWNHIGSTSCDALWTRLDRAGWTWRTTENGGMPAPGDLVFFVKLVDAAPILHEDATPDLDHVGFVDGDAQVLSGNHHDAVGYSSRSLCGPAVWGFARVPW